MNNADNTVAQAKMNDVYHQQDAETTRRNMLLALEGLNTQKQLGVGNLNLGFGDLGLRGELGRGNLALGNRDLDVRTQQGYLGNRMNLANLIFGNLL